MLLLTNILDSTHTLKHLKDSYSTPKLLKKLKRYASYQRWRHLAESQILSKVEYCNVIFESAKLLALRVHVLTCQRALRV